MITIGDGSHEFVYLHGVLGLDADNAALSALARYGRVHAPLLPGYGDEPEDPELRTMLDITLYMLDVIDSLALTDPIVVGYCMGGMVAAEMAAVAPSDVKRLALVTPLGIWIDEHPIPDVFAMTPHDIAAVLGSPPETTGDLQDFTQLEAVLVRNARQLGMAGKLLFPIPDRGLANRIHRIKADVLLVWGGQDRYVDAAYSRRFQEALPAAKTLVLHDAGHMLPEEHSTALAAAINEHFFP